MKKTIKPNKKTIFAKYRPFLIPIAAFSGLVLIVIILVIQMTAMSFTLSKVVDNSSSSKESIDAVVQTLLIETKYTNELRAQIGLSEITYPIQKLLESRNANEDESAKNLSFFRAIDKLYETNVEEKNISAFQKIVKNSDFQTFVKDGKFAIKNNDKLSIEIMKGDTEYLQIRYIPDSESITIESYLGDTIEKAVFTNATFDKLRAWIKDIDSHNVLLESTLASFLKIKVDQNLLAALKDKDLSFINIENSNDNYTLAAGRKNSEFLRFGLHKKELIFFIDDKNYKLYDEFSKNIVDAVKKVDAREESDKIVDKIDAEIKSVINDKSFRTLLDIKKLNVSSVPRPDYYFMYYDITDKSGKKVGSFAIDRFHPATYLMDKDDVQISSLKALVDAPADENVKKKLEIPASIPVINDIYDSKGSFTFLLLGANEGNTDTIILIHVDDARKKVTMFSLPRDLFYRGRRINAVYSYWGKDQFLKEVTLITGLNIQKFICVDMFAFIDVINIIGGVDVSLDADLIDPTYKVKEDGEWSTLCYKRGSYHFNGLEALRVARSRNFSSDFDRAKRQQKIIVAVRDKFKSFGVQNLDKVYAILSSLTKYVQTNFTPLEMVTYFGKFKDYVVSDQHTIDTSNVLYSTYSNIYLLKPEEIPKDENFDKGAWIALPKDNDWNVIKWYIREMIAQ